MQKLEKEGFLNEERYARAFAGDKLRFQGWGRMKIRAALQAKKVPGAVIDAALNELDETTYREKLLQLRERKLRELRGEKDAFVKRQKVSRFLLGRGFTLDEIVAEEGIEPTTFGYEPDELPLLYSAIQPSISRKRLQRYCFFLI